MSLFLKYRPKSLEEMVGQRHIIDILLAQAEQGKFSSSYMLYGPRGTGKTTTARLLAKLVNVTQKTDEGKPDILNDPIVSLIDQNKTLDYVEIDAASHTGVDNIRDEIIDKAAYPPSQLNTKVYVIDEVHMLSKGAFNALLKIMEEPKDYLKFVLATTEINKVPDTIISRCQVFNFKHLSVDEMVGRLEYIAKEESMEYDKEALRLIAKLSNGGMRDAIKYLEQVSILGAVTQESVSQFLGVVSLAELSSLMETIKSYQYEEITTALSSLVDGGTDLYALAKDLLLYSDEHFMDDPEFYSVFTGLLQEISAEMKRYPHPLLVWKKKLYHLCKTLGGDISPGSPSPTQTTTNSASNSTSNSASNKTSDNTSNSTKNASADNTANTDNTTDTDTTANTDNTTDTDKTANTDKTSDSTPALDSTKTPAPDTTKDTDKDSATTSKTATSEKPDKPDSSDDDGNDDPHEKLMQEIISKVDKVMIKSALKQQAVIKEVSDETIHFILINQQFYTLFEKKETITYLSDIISDILGRSITVRAEYMSKEDFMMQGL